VFRRDHDRTLWELGVCKEQLATAEARLRDVETSTSAAVAEAKEEVRRVAAAAAAAEIGFERQKVQATAAAEAATKEARDDAAHVRRQLQVADGEMERLRVVEGRLRGEVRDLEGALASARAEALNGHSNVTKVTQTLTEDLARVRPATVRVSTLIAAFLTVRKLSHPQVAEVVHNAPWSRRLFFALKSR
jgi:chromosome segregation ATPase